jgi:hypothetical protein
MRTIAPLAASDLTALRIEMEDDLQERREIATRPIKTDLSSVGAALLTLVPWLHLTPHVHK